MCDYIMSILSVSLLHVHIASAEHRRSLGYGPMRHCRRRQ
jgi:hypothetical protein